MANLQKTETLAENQKDENTVMLKLQSVESDTVACFVCGFKQGGTTFFCKILSAHTQIDGRFECGFLLAGSPRNIPEIRPKVVQNLKRAWKLDDKDLSDISHSETFDAAYQLLHQKAGLSAGSRIYDKFPDYVLHIDEIARNTSKPIFVVLRDPGALFWSRQKRHLKKNDLRHTDKLKLESESLLDVEGFAREYNHIVDIVDKAAGKYPNVHVFTLEELVTNFETTRQRIFQILNLPVPDESFGDNGVSTAKVRNGVDVSVLQGFREHLAPDVIDKITTLTRQKNSAFNVNAAPGRLSSSENRISEMDKSIQSRAEEIQIKVAPVYESLAAEFTRLREAGDKQALDFDLGFASARGELREGDQPWANAAIKYVRFPKQHIEKNIPFVQELTELRGKKIYELGVGPGYLFKLLEDVLDCDVYGCDVRVNQTAVYKGARTALGIHDKVKELAVRAHRPIGLEEGTEAVLGFWTVFNKKWTTKDHIWFIDHCRENLVGAKKLVLRFNDEGYTDQPDIVEFYRKIGRFPLVSDPNFVIVDL